jgi:arginase
VPTAAAAHSPGIDKAPRALRDAGLVERLRGHRLDVDDRGDLPHVPFRIDKEHRLAQNAGVVADVARRVADRTSAVVGAGGRPLVVGGDCTILIGALAGTLTETESLGLVYLDAHPDLNTPANVVQGALDWMGMAHILGVAGAVPELSHIGPRFPLLSWDQVVFLAYVESEVTQGERALLAGASRAYPSTVVAGRARAVAARSARWLEDRVSRFLVHFDVDVIDFVDFPIADNAYQRNQGLTLADALRALAALAQSKAFGGVVLTQVNPDHAAGQGPLLEEFAERFAQALAGADATS